MTLGSPVSPSQGINKLKAFAAEALDADDCNNVASNAVTLALILP